MKEKIVEILKKYEVFEVDIPDEQQRDAEIKDIADEMLTIIPQGTFYVEVDASEELPESNLVHVIVDTKYRNRDVAVYEPSEGVWINMDGSLIEVKSWLKKVTNDSVGASLKHHSDMIELLAEYTDFLLKEGYCDTDVYSEPPTAIDQFMKTKL